MRIEAACGCGAQIAATGPEDALAVVEQAWDAAHADCAGAHAVTRYPGGPSPDGPPLHR